MEAWLRKNPPRRSQYRSPRRARLTGLVVVHTAENVMDTVDVDTGAENVANFIRNRDTPGSYHDLVDSDSNIKLVRYSDEAYQDGTGSNPYALSISFACRTSNWKEMDSARRAAFLGQGARAFARQQKFLKDNGFPLTSLRRVNKEQSAAGQAGFISHGERDPGRRSDPGADFPWEEFFEACLLEMGGSPTPQPNPTPTPTPAPSIPGKETAMFIVDDPDGNQQWLCGFNQRTHIKTWPEVLAYREAGFYHFTEKPETVDVRRALLASRTVV